MSNYISLCYITLLFMCLLVDHHLWRVGFWWYEGSHPLRSFSLLAEQGGHCLQSEEWVPSQSTSGSQDNADGWWKEGNSLCLSRLHLSAACDECWRVGETSHLSFYYTIFVNTPFSTHSVLTHTSAYTHTHTLSLWTVKETWFWQLLSNSCCYGGRVHLGS